MRQYRQTATIGGVLLAALVITGCSDTIRRDVGIVRESPDEFQVVRRKPLIIPPDASLRPPASGAIRASTAVSDEAESIVTGSANEQISASAAEQALLARTQINVLPNIRTVILEETTQRRQLSEDRFLFILDSQRRAMRAQEAEPIDPNAEAERLVNEGLAKKVVTIKTGSTQTTGGGS